MLTKAEIQAVRALREKKHRMAQGRFVIEGEKVVAELVAAGFRFEAIYATPAWPGEPTHRVTESDMSRLSHFPSPATVLAVGPVLLQPLAPRAWMYGFTLALDGVQDPGNVGTLLRLADWYGLDRVAVSTDCADLFSQKVINASMGSFARVRIETGDLAGALEQSGAPVLGCDLAGQDVHTLAPVASAVIVIGSEGRGLSPAVRARVTQSVTIPRYGSAESLNAALAAAIVCDNLRRIGSPALAR